MHRRADAEGHLESPRVPQAERCARNQLVQRDDHGRGARPSALPDGDQGRGLVPGLHRPRQRQVPRVLQDARRGMARAVHLQGQSPRHHHRNLPAPARHQAELHAAHGERRDERPDVVGERRHAPPAQRARDAASRLRHDFATRPRRGGHPSDPQGGGWRALCKLGAPERLRQECRGTLPAG